MSIFYKVVLRAFLVPLFLEERWDFLEPPFLEWCLCLLLTLEVTLSLLIRSLRVLVDKRPETRLFVDFLLLVLLFLVAAIGVKNKDNKQKIIKFD